MDFNDNDYEHDLFSAKVTISVTSRNGKKCRTNVIGMANDLDLPKILSYLKNKYKCGGAILKDQKYGEILSFTGDQKENIYHFLVSEEIYPSQDILIRGV